MPKPPLTKQQLNEALLRKARLQADPTGEQLKLIGDLSNQYREFAKLKADLEGAPDYVGALTDWTGDIESGIEAKTAGEKTGIAGMANKLLNLTPGQADFWARYAEQVNVIRHDLFGGQLTDGEAEQFKKQSMTPGHSPEMAGKRIDHQLDVLANKLNGLANGLTRSNVPVETIRAVASPPVFDDIVERAAKEERAFRPTMKQRQPGTEF